MKAMMSEKLRNILNNPQRSRELQKLLVQSDEKTLHNGKKELGKENNLIIHGTCAK